MNEALKLILLQTTYYTITMLIGFLVIAFLQRGFFWKYLKVRASLGKYILIKYRGVMRDSFLVGWEQEGMLCFKDSIDKKRKEPVRLTLPRDEITIYRAMGINWIDIDQEKNAIMTHSYKGVTGYDARKYSDLITRSLQKPALLDSTNTLIIALIVVAILLIGVTGYFSYTNYSKLAGLANLITALKDQIKTSAVVAAGSIV